MPPIPPGIPPPIIGALSSTSSAITHSVVNNIAAIEFESSVTDLYENETSHYEIVNWLFSYGFVPWQLVVTHWDRSLRTISLDSIFVRN